MTSATGTKEGRQKVRPVNVFPETVRCFWRKLNVLGGNKTGKDKYEYIPSSQLQVCFHRMVKDTYMVLMAYLLT